MGKKNKALKRQQKRQRTALKAARRAKAKRQILARQRHQNHKVTEAQFPDDQVVFWICHGINYLLSDYDEGTWTPLFEGIYNGNLPDPDVIARTVLDKYGEDAESWPLEGKAAMAWSVQDRASLYAYYRGAKRRVQEKDPECDADALVTAPHNGHVWQLFNMVRETITRKHGPIS